MAYKVGVLLAGCGYLDGAEIHESVCTLLALDEAKAKAVCIATDIEFDVINHVTGALTGERRNVLVEAGRIARGDIQDIKDVSENELDALVIPGGYGVAKNFSDFAFKGKDMYIDHNVENFIRGIHASRKPIGAICISPAIISKLIPGVMLTIGNDSDTAMTLKKMGTVHYNCTVNDVIVDRKNRIVSTPAYMLGSCIDDVNKGIRRCIHETLALLDA